MIEDGKGVKFGGRQKGTPNKKTQHLIDIADRLGCDPFEILILFAKGDWETLGYREEKYVASSSDKGETLKYTIEPAVRAKCAAEAASYLYPKRKAIELSGDADNPVDLRVALSLEDRKELARAARENAGK